MNVHVFLMVFVALSLSACSSTPPKPKEEAIYEALKVDTTLRSWVDACRGVSSKTSQLADLTYQNWWRRNGDLVEGADFGLAYSLIEVTDSRQEAGARLAMSITWSVVQQAKEEVADIVNPSTDAESVCMRTLGQYNDGSFDLKENSAVYPLLAELQRDKQNHSDELSLKRAAIEKRTGKEYGRSYYLAEQLFKKIACAGADVHLLSNAWPYEVYNAQCQDGAFVLIRCEWGHCSIIK